MVKKTFTKLAISGNAGPKVRSDCKIELELTDSKGIQIDLTSKVESLYGNSIRKQLLDALKLFNIKNARLKITDSGALPFVIDARIEAAVKQLVQSEKKILPPFSESALSATTPDRIRFTRLYLPGNTPSMMLNAGIHKPDAAILDLEDSVVPEKKHEARYLVRNALRALDFMGSERMVRINQIPAGLDDLPYIVPNNVHVLLIPKCEGPEHIYEVEKVCRELLPEDKNIHWPYFMPIIESALGVEKVYDIIQASNKVVAVAIGLEDYTADLGVARTKQGMESFYARTRIVNSCKASGVQAIDSVFSDMNDEKGLYENVKISKSLGFEGMGCIHPGQIEIIRRGFQPEKEEIEKAKKIVKAFDLALEKGLGVVSLGSKMIDPPVVERAQKTIKLAQDFGLLDSDWRQNE